MKFTDNLNPRNFKYVTHIALKATCEEILNSEFLVVMAAVQKKVELELSLEKSTFPQLLIVVEDAFRLLIARNAICD